MSLFEVSIPENDGYLLWFCPLQVVIVGAVLNIMNSFRTGDIINFN